MALNEQARNVATSATFEKHLRCPMPQWLHHYTTQAGLLGIISEATLRATKIQYMNDAMELKLALDLAKRRIKARPTDHDDALAAKLERLPQRLDNITNVNVFVGCFCEDGDLLSQWRGYAGASHGYSITMHARILSECARDGGFAIGQCIYDEQVQANIVDELIDDSLQLATPEDRAAALEWSLLTTGAFFKDASFAGEKEWRVVSGVTDIRMQSVDFRPGQSMLVPFRALDLRRGFESAVWGAVVGPCPHPELSKSSIQMLYQRHALASQQGAPWPINRPAVKTSSIPYRNW